MAYQWTVYATMTTLVVAVIGLLATALFQQGAKIDRLADRVDGRFDAVDGRFDAVDERMRDDKAELLSRMDVLAERITRLEAG